MGEFHWCLLVHQGFKQFKHLENTDTLDATPEVGGEKFKDLNLRMDFFKLFSGDERKKNILNPQKLDQRQFFFGPLKWPKHLGVLSG